MSPETLWDDLLAEATARSGKHVEKESQDRRMFIWFGVFMFVIWCIFCIIMMTQPCRDCKHNGFGSCCYTQCHFNTSAWRFLLFVIVVPYSIFMLVVWEGSNRHNRDPCGLTEALLKLTNFDGIAMSSLLLADVKRIWASSPSTKSIYDSVLLADAVRKHSIVPPTECKNRTQRSAM